MPGLPQTWIGWLILILVLLFIIKQPTLAAHDAHRIGAGLSSAATGIANFFSAL
jgi:hypothetical protein